MSGGQCVIMTVSACDGDPERDLAEAGRDTQKRTIHG